MTPVEASKKEYEVTIFRNLYPDFDKRPTKPTKLSVGDQVRIHKKKGIFEKVFTPNWTEDVFTVSNVQRTNPVTFQQLDR